MTTKNGQRWWTKPQFSWLDLFWITVVSSVLRVLAAVIEKALR